MNRLKITGGKPLKGTVKIAGAKNAASKMIIASLLTEDEVVLENVPLQQETDIARELVEMLGATTSQSDHTMTIAAKKIANTSALAQTRKNRLPILLVAPLLHRVGEAHIPAPGGDKIGPRPVNFHVETLEKMGAKVEENKDGFHFKVDGRLKGVKIELPYPSVGATETA
ncbi:MAG: UDP-N-acetylglucosamine 1-carboxyvinyltransferase, partial [bacterium]